VKLKETFLNCHKKQISINHARGKNYLSILSIENHIPKSLPYEEAIKEQAAKTRRKKKY
jgi:hypothetical protein